ncbi:MAG TPA: DUF5996 family protein [Polyangiales bacterium]|nr:DUF5996 family protein [Polyangiales bacterium]
MPSKITDWPELPYAAWQGTCTSLHLWSQIVGKLRLAKTPWLNHSWHVALYVTPRGLATSPITDGSRTFEIIFDFDAHRLRIETSDGASRALPLQPQSVADFYAKLLSTLRELGIEAHIHGKPNEIPDAIPFKDDRAPREYDREYATRFWRVLMQADRVFKTFRTGFLGKASPVHFFWGSFDMAVTRFSGRTAPPHPGGVPNLPDPVTREAYSHEVSSAGFWPGGAGSDAAFYSYAYPEPKGFRDTKVRPAEAFFDPKMAEFFLPYASLRAAKDPDATLLEFLQSTYEAAANAASWDRKALECSLGVPGVPRAVPAG